MVIQRGETRLASGAEVLVPGTAADGGGRGHDLKNKRRGERHSMSKGMGNLYLWPLAIGLALISAVATATALAPGQVLRTPWLPLEGQALNNCNDEFVDVSGKYLTEIRVTEDASGGVHLVVLVRVVYTGVGTTTGSKYVGNDGGHVSETIVSAGAYTFTAPFVGMLVSLDGSAPDSHFRSIQHITIDANNNLRSSMDNFEIFCQ